MKDSTLDRKKLQRKENVSKKSFKDERRYQEEAV